MVNDRPVVSSSVPGVADSQASGRAHGVAGAGSSLIIGQPGVWSAGGHIIVVRVHPHCQRRPRSLA